MRQLYKPVITALLSIGMAGAQTPAKNVIFFWATAPASPA